MFHHFRMHNMRWLLLSALLGSVSGHSNTVSSSVRNQKTQQSTTDSLEKQAYLQEKENEASEFLFDTTLIVFIEF